MSNVQELWVNLAARVMRCLMAKKDITYGQLAERLASLGFPEEEKPLATKVSLGRIKLSALLKVLHVAHAEVPWLWRSVLTGEGDWEGAARQVIRLEMGEVLAFRDFDEVAAKMREMGSGFSQKTIKEHLETGNLFLPEFLKFLVLMNSKSLNDFVEFKDLLEVAR